NDPAISEQRRRHRVLDRVVLLAGLDVAGRVYGGGDGTVACARPHTGSGGAIRLLAVKVAGFAGYGIQVLGGAVDLSASTITVQNNRADGFIVGAGGLRGGSVGGPLVTLTNT